MDEEKLTHFYYRDDALKIWDAIQSFSAEIVALSYRDDEDVELDEELGFFLQVSSLLLIHDHSLPYTES